MRKIPWLVAAAAGFGWAVAASRSGALPGGVDRGARIRAADRELDELSGRKRHIEIAGVRVAYLDEGEGEPLLLLDGSIPSPLRGCDFPPHKLPPVSAGGS